MTERYGHSATSNTRQHLVVGVALVELELLLHLHGTAILLVLLQPRPLEQVSQVSPGPHARPSGLRFAQLLRCDTRGRRWGFIHHV